MQRRAVVGGLFSLLLPLALPGEAEAAKSGGRVGGGGGFRARSAPRAPVGGGSAGFARPSVTVIQTAPSMPFGYGYGGGFGYGFGERLPAVSHAHLDAGGFGMSPGTALGLTAIEIAESLVREQRRQAFLQEQLRIQQQLGKDQGQVDAGSPCCPQSLTCLSLSLSLLCGILVGLVLSNRSRRCSSNLRRPTRSLLICRRRRRLLLPSEVLQPLLSSSSSSSLAPRRSQ